MASRKIRIEKREEGLVQTTDYDIKTSATVKSATRVLNILEFFDDIQREATVSEIATKLDFPQSSTSVLLKSLVELGYLEYDVHSRTFIPSPRVALLGNWLEKGPIRDGSLLRMVEHISTQTSETVIVAARAGIFSQYIHVLQSKAGMRLYVPPGARRFLVWSATGYALLLRETDDEIRSLCLRTNSEATSEFTRVRVKSVLQNVEQLRTTGFFFSKGLVTPGAGTIAAPLPREADGRGRPLAIAVAGLLQDLERREGEIVETILSSIDRFLVARPK